jgi:hypothetical protein
MTTYAWILVIAQAAWILFLIMRSYQRHWETEDIRDELRRALESKVPEDPGRDVMPQVTDEFEDASLEERKAWDKAYFAVAGAHNTWTDPVALSWADTFLRQRRARFGIFYDSSETTDEGIDQAALEHIEASLAAQKEKEGR